LKGKKQKRPTARLGDFRCFLNEDRSNKRRGSWRKKRRGENYLKRRAANG